MLWGQCARGIYHTLFLLIDTFIVTANILESERTNPSICANLVFVLVGKLPFQKCAKSLPGFDFHFLQFHFPRNKKLPQQTCAGSLPGFDFHFLQFHLARKKKIAITDMRRVTAFSFSTISSGQEQENCKDTSNCLEKVKKISYFNQTN